MSMTSSSKDERSSDSQEELDPVKLVEEYLLLKSTPEVDRSDRILWERFIQLCYQHRNGRLVQTKFEMAKDVTVEKIPENSEFVDFLLLFDPIFGFARVNTPDKYNPFILSKLFDLKELGYLPFTTNENEEFPFFDFSDVTANSSSASSQKTPLLRLRKRRSEHHGEKSSATMKRQKEGDEESMEDHTWWRYLSAVLLYKERKGHFPQSREETITGDDKTIFEVGKWLQREKKRLSKYYNNDSEKYSVLTDLMTQGLWTE